MRLGTCGMVQLSIKCSLTFLVFINICMYFLVKHISIIKIIYSAVLCQTFKFTMRIINRQVINFVQSYNYMYVHITYVLKYEYNLDVFLYV